ISWGLLAAVAMLLVAATDAPSLKTLVTPLHVCLVGWLLINIALAENRGVSMQRFVLAVSVTSLAVLLPLLPPTQRVPSTCAWARPRSCCSRFVISASSSLRNIRSTPHSTSPSRSSPATGAAVLATRTSPRR
ncbi:hypothetical protein QUS65_22700, partial [Xanthomonas citri pv. citri]